MLTKGRKELNYSYPITQGLMARRQTAGAAPPMPGRPGYRP